MSRVGKLPVRIPRGVTVQVADNRVQVKGPKGQLSHTLAEPIVAERGEDGQLYVNRPNDERRGRCGRRRRSEGRRTRRPSQLAPD